MFDRMQYFIQDPDYTRGKPTRIQDFDGKLLGYNVFKTLFNKGPLSTIFWFEDANEIRIAEVRVKGAQKYLDTSGIGMAFDVYAFPEQMRGRIRIAGIKTDYHWSNNITTSSWSVMDANEMPSASTEFSTARREFTIHDRNGGAAATLKPAPLAGMLQIDIFSTAVDALLIISLVYCILRYGMR